MADGANVELIRDMISAGNRAAETGELDDWLRFFSEDVVCEAAEDAPDAGIYRGHEGLCGYLQDWLETVDAVGSELRRVTEVGDRVVTDIRAHARIKGTDSDMAFDYSQVLLIEDGKITYVKEFLKHDDAVAYADASARGSGS